MSNHLLYMKHGCTSRLKNCMIFKTMSPEWHVFKRTRPWYSRPCHLNDMSSNGPDHDIQDHVTWMTCLQTDQTMIFKTMSHWMTCLQTDQTMIFKTMSPEWHVFKRTRPWYSRPCHLNDMSSNGPDHDIQDHVTLNDMSSNGPDHDIQDHVTWMTCLQTDQTMIFKTMSPEWHVFKRTRPWYSRQCHMNEASSNEIDQRQFCLVFNTKQRLMTFRWKLSLFINQDWMLHRTCTGQAGLQAAPGWTEPRFAGRVGPGLESISDIENTTYSLFAKQILSRPEMDPRTKEQMFNQSTKPRPDSIHDLDDWSRFDFTRDGR